MQIAWHEPDVAVYAISRWLLNVNNVDLAALIAAVTVKRLGLELTSSTFRGWPTFRPCCHPRPSPIFKRIIVFKRIESWPTGEPLSLLSVWPPNSWPSRMRSQVSLAVTLYGFAVVSHALSIRQQSPVTVPFARRMNLTGAANIVDQDTARSKALREKAYDNIVNVQEASIFDVPAQNQAVSYVASVSSLTLFSLKSWHDYSSDWYRSTAYPMSVTVLSFRQMWLNVDMMTSRWSPGRYWKFKYLARSR